ncbi:ADP-ribosylglycohydrolase family protein [Lysinibacillus endophyticus]|uniref:ADP-ribosylglycohydrolase family protein n=1 Tax=Ureibacillus endophyticus TaxID=1978490 RepID=UPI00209DFECD|nr:ADP-ribosylglycohydrolase family protein [Lysinibacillus endophyticus]MCP1146058.1 ADP-ribosylglycohydrolase family protein [Lysinibacillus endophyticus]
MLDRILGGLFGVAIGDALGATTEFMSQKEIEKEHGIVDDIIGGGCWDVLPGETTDDTAMTIAVAKGIITNRNNPIDDMGKEFLKWKNTDPKDIGITIRVVFDRFNGNWFEAAKSAHDYLDGKSAGNGSLMRCLPIALAYPKLDKIEELTIAHSKMTHYDDLASEACVIYNRIAYRVLNNEDLKSSILDEIKNTRYEKNAASKPDCPPDGFVVNSMKWVLYWLLNSDTFEEVIIGATNMGGDSDTIAAIAGGLKGLEVGYEKLPNHYKDKLLDKAKLNELAHQLHEIREQETLNT